jgi:hypothetical protein
MFLSDLASRYPGNSCALATYFADMAKMSELIPRMSGSGPQPNIFAFCTPIATNALNIFQRVS